MRSRKNMMLAIALGTLLGINAPAALAGERVKEAKQIDEIARNASSPADHAKAAKQYLDRAESLTQKADKLERELRQTGTSPMNQKWPGMMAGMKDRKERDVMQARRAANEARELAQHHSRLAGRSLEQIAALD
jgi:hypothetical protein